ncbi:MAG: OmpA family protein [bacterium]|nr:OmpA family protein [bacterium]
MNAMNNTTRYRLLGIPHLPSTVGSGKSVVNNYTINNYNSGRCGCYGSALFGYGFNNCGCGFGFGNIGNYFKFGFGMGLANLATGLLGFGVNWLMNGISTGNWRLNNCGYGMGYGFGNGSYWGGGYYTPGTDGTERGGRVKSKNDIDNAKFAPLITKIRGLKNDKDLTPAKIQAVYKEILDDIKNTDNNHKDSDVATYQALLNDLDDIIADKGYTVDKKTGAVTDPNAPVVESDNEGNGSAIPLTNEQIEAIKAASTPDELIDELDGVDLTKLSDDDLATIKAQLQSVVDDCDNKDELNGLLNAVKGNPTLKAIVQKKINELEEAEKAKEPKTLSDDDIKALAVKLNEIDGIKAEVKGKEIKLTAILFEHASADLQSSAITKLNAILAQIKGTGYKSVVSHGYTNTKGDDKGYDNKGLSDRRAKAVSEYLNKNDEINDNDNAYIEVGHGSDNVVKKADDNEDFDASRRTEIVITF